MLAPILQTFVRRDREILDGTTGEVPLHVVSERGQAHGLARVGIEHEEPVHRTTQVLRIPVQLDPGLRPIDHSVVTGRDWRRNSESPTIAHSMSCGAPKRSSRDVPAATSVFSSSGVSTPPCTRRSVLTSPLRSTM